MQDTKHTLVFFPWSFYVVFSLTIKTRGNKKLERELSIKKLLNMQKKEKKTTKNPSLKTGMQHMKRLPTILTLSLLSLSGAPWG